MFNRERLTKLKDVAKTNAVKTLAAGNTITPIIGIWRDNEPYCWVIPPSPDENQPARDPILLAAQVCIVGMEPDAITMVNDTYHAKQETKHDGSTWEAGEMQYAVENNTVDAKLVNDCVMVAVVDKSVLTLEDLEGFARPRRCGNERQTRDRGGKR